MQFRSQKVIKTWSACIHPFGRLFLLFHVRDVEGFQAEAIKEQCCGGL